ncbi:MAG: hypothetical protein EBZ36_17495 [Acidobacteria bacterium]|nr:hypothetical protein [Acidobacteriota bacterium]
MHVGMMHHMQDTHTFYLDVQHQYVQLMLLPISLGYEHHTPPHQLPLMYHMERRYLQRLDRYSA